MKTVKAYGADLTVSDLKQFDINRRGVTAKVMK